MLMQNPLCYSHSGFFLCVLESSSYLCYFYISDFSKLSFCCLLSIQCLSFRVIINITYLAISQSSTCILNSRETTSLIRWRKENRRLYEMLSKGCINSFAVCSRPYNSLLKSRSGRLRQQKGSTLQFVVSKILHDVSLHHAHCLLSPNRWQQKCIVFLKISKLKTQYNNLYNNNTVILTVDSVSSQGTNRECPGKSRI